jgi:long-subunit acyl-CoA synthetase (AMP-forming)
MKFAVPTSARLTDLVSGQSLNQSAIEAAVLEWQQLLTDLSARRLVLWADTSLDWVLLDLACLNSQQLLVPMPLFASQGQLAHVLSAVGPEFLLSDREVPPVWAQQLGLTLRGRCRSFYLYQTPASLQQQALPVPSGTQKITFTSGSTGQPKGVCLSVQTQLNTAQSLVERISPKLQQSQSRHLCLLPLSLLLENIAGVYAPLIAGGEVLLMPDAGRGFAGSSLANPQQLLGLISQTQPNSLILVPELLQLLVQAALKGWPVPASLQFIAVGGAKVAADTLRQAAALKLPVFQGYGLSECGSVVALCSVDAAHASDDELQSAGKPLAHLEVRIEQGEIEVKTPFLGYLGQSVAAQSDWVATGDLGQWTQAGDLQILGRRNNLLISSFGRNISPEWVESELTKTGLIQQAVLFGDAKPYCVALLYATPAVSDAQLNDYLDWVNQQLPDYARVVRYHRLTTALSQADSTLTSNGRPRRAAILQQYQQQISVLYPAE